MAIYKYTTYGREDALLKLILSLRDAYRSAGNYDMADQIRKNLKVIGVTVNDKKPGF